MRLIALPLFIFLMIEIWYEVDLAGIIPLYLVFISLLKVYVL